MPLYRPRNPGATRRGTLVAAFPAQAADRVQSGQLALLRPQNDLAKRAKGIPAMVMEVRNKVIDAYQEVMRMQV